MKKDEILRKTVRQEDPAAYIARWFILSLLLTVLLELPVIWLENRLFIPPLLRMLGERTTDVDLTELLVQAFRLAVSLLLGGAETSVFTSSFSILICCPFWQSAGSSPAGSTPTSVSCRRPETRTGTAMRSSGTC